MTARRVDVVLFDGFELLDAAGPIELLTAEAGLFDLHLLAPRTGAVHSAQGVTLVVGEAYREAPAPDIILVPGGPGTRDLVHDRDFLAWLSAYAAQASLVTSVCTGSALLAAAGALEGYRATSNKVAFDWVAGHGDDVHWVPSARWVVDRSRWTSSGVAAGMDMTAALIRHLHGDDVAERVLGRVELEVRTDPTDDPFARPR